MDKVTQNSWSKDHIWDSFKRKESNLHKRREKFQIKYQILSNVILRQEEKGQADI